MEIKENIEKIKKTLPSNVTLVAVSKTKPLEDIIEAYNNGQRDFGENKIQELIEKEELLNKDIRWHLIGNVQTNKVKYIVGKVHLIHSLSSIKLLQKIELEFSKKNCIANTLIQINIGREESKKYFKRVKKIFDDLSKRNFKNITMEILSMGMTNDYIEAIEEGSTLIRVGQGIFGKRSI